jgi:paired amphipathic helix protein Sin3a
MRVRISLPLYKLVYESGSEDFVCDVRSRDEEDMLRERARERGEERRKSRWLLGGEPE